MHVWRYQLSQDYTYNHPEFALVRNIAVPYVSIKDSTIRIGAGYSWDGCSPKLYILGFWTVGTPDGALKQGLPWTYHASLVHDALCQYRHVVGLNKQQVLRVFNDQLAEAKWPLRKLYVWAVDKFGPQDFAE